MNTNFTWIDLSTFDIGKASSFYQAVFGWKVSTDDSGYVNCFLGRDPCAGLYEMPTFFQEISMPSFWMTYIAVEDAKGMAAKAKTLGGKVELEEENSMGRIALIRDPAGAGFTCYEGRARAAGRDFFKPGAWCWSELMVSDIDLVKDFYTTLFDWQIELESKDRFEIRNSAGQKMGSIQVANEEVKGAKEFWAVYFSVLDLQESLQVIKNAGGRAGSIYPHEHGTQAIAYDDQDAAFFIIQSTANGIVI